MSTDFNDDRPEQSAPDAADDLDDLRDVAVPADTNPADWQEQHLAVEDPDADAGR